jgi:opacity protein-like surface antigen
MTAFARPALLFVFGLAPAVLQAQDARASSPPPSSLRAFGDFGYRSFAATKSFNAILGKSSGWTPGGGAQFVWRDRLFAQAGVSRFSADGDRTFRFNGQAYGLGIPVTVTTTSFELSAGYRFRTPWRVSPYLGAGLGSLSYTEISKFAEGAENVDRSKVTYHVLGGLEVRLHRWIALGAQGQYTWASGLIGADGVSKDFGEKSLAGPSLRLRILIGPELKRR